jgi:hypothetical protein
MKQTGALSDDTINPDFKTYMESFSSYFKRELEIAEKEEPKIKLSLASG